jgi:hypothetical protein
MSNSASLFVPVLTFAILVAAYLWVAFRLV